MVSSFLVLFTVICLTGQQVTYLCTCLCVWVMSGFSIIWMSLIRTIFPPCSHNSHTQLMQCISHKRQVYYRKWWNKCKSYTWQNGDVGVCLFYWPDSCKKGVNRAIQWNQLKTNLLAVWICWEMVLHTSFLTGKRGTFTFMQSKSIQN